MSLADLLQDIPVKVKELKESEADLLAARRVLIDILLDKFFSDSEFLKCYPYQESHSFEGFYFNKQAEQGHRGMYTFAIVKDKQKKTARVYVTCPNDSGEYSPVDPTNFIEGWKFGPENEISRDKIASEYFGHFIGGLQLITDRLLDRYQEDTNWNRSRTNDIGRSIEKLKAVANKD